VRRPARADRRHTVARISFHGALATVPGMGTQRGIARWLAGGAGMLGLVAALGLPAHASTPLTINFMVCQGLGANLMDCEVSVSGGSGDYTYHWSSTTDDSEETVFPCSTGFPPTGTESVTVTDTAGGSATTSRTYFCIGGPEA
jgi:hypothetical protein